MRDELLLVGGGEEAREKRDEEVRGTYRGQRQWR